MKCIKKLLIDVQLYANICNAYFYVIEKLQFLRSDMCISVHSYVYNNNNIRTTLSGRETSQLIKLIISYT